MRILAALFVLVFAQPAALAQHANPSNRNAAQRPMPAPERRMGWDERQRLREQVHNGQMTRDEARARWHEERARRALEPGRSPEERERLRRDVQEANRDLERR